MTVRRILAAAVLATVATVSFAAKKDEDRVADLEARVAALEKSLADIDARLQARVDAAIQDLAQREQRADEALREITNLYNQGKHLEARGALDAFNAKYAGTEAAKRAARMGEELNVVGKPAPAEFAVEKWYVPGDPVDLSAPGTTLLVFFEEWCPHCKREVPKLKETYARMKAEGLHVVALTKLTRGATDEKVQAMIQEGGLDFPIAKETGALSEYFNISGIPAAAVVKDGRVIWRGHPANLSDAVLKGML
jgi:thiol-disulfide isomerase/thioredoxin